MKRYALLSEGVNILLGGNKARHDAIRSAAELGWQVLALPRSDNKAKDVAVKIAGLARVMAMPKATLFVQLPVYGAYAAKFVALANRRHDIVALLHDVDAKRELPDNLDTRLLKSFKAIIPTGRLDLIVPDAAMLPLCERLPVWDYRISDEFVLRDWQPDGDLLIAGSLAYDKARWVYGPDIPGLKLHLYGAGYEPGRSVGTHAYYGSFSPDRPAFAPGVSWGIVWDGPSASAGEGDYGLYQRYNAPLRFSMYLAVGLPVIVGRTAATAEFVTRENCGLVVDSLHDLPERLRSLSSEDKHRMRTAALRIGQRIRRGEFFKTVMNVAMQSFEGTVPRVEDRAVGKGDPMETADDGDADPIGMRR